MPQPGRPAAGKALAPTQPALGAGIGAPARAPRRARGEGAAHAVARRSCVCVPLGGCQTAELGCASRGTPLAVPGLSEQQRGALSARGVCGGPAVVRLGLQSALGYGV